MYPIFFGILTQLLGDTSDPTNQKPFSVGVDAIFNNQNPGGSFLGWLYLAFVTIGSAVAFGFLVYGGIMYFLAYGNEERAKQAKAIIMWAIVGILVTVFAAVLIFFVVYTITKPGSGDFVPLPTVLPNLP